MEIVESKKTLEAVLDRKVRSFAYPYGTRAHYASETVDLVRQAGFEYACSNFPGVVRPNADILQLPRILVRDWDGDTFKRFLKKWII